MRLSKLWLCIFFAPLFCLAQDKGRLPLRAILEQVTAQHGIKFSYIEEELAVYALTPPNTNLPAKDKIRYIEQRTRLKFEPVNDTYYTVYNDVRMDKPLCGYLADAQTGLPVENAEIYIPGKGVSVSSGANGYFSLPVLAPNTIYIRHLGYAEKAVSPSELYVPDCPTIHLSPIIMELQEVVANQYLAKGITKQAPGEVLIRPRKFGVLPGLTDPDVLQAMQQLPGVGSVDETVSNINVRGGTHDQNLFLWNGIRMFQTSHFYGLISAFNPLQATNIRIYKNGTPARYGESVSSLADISTHSSIPDSTYSIAAADMVNINFLTMLKLSPNDRLQLSGRRTYADLWASPTFEGYQHRIFQNTTVTDVQQNREVPVQSKEKFYFYDVSASYQRRLGERHELKADAIAMQNDLDVYQRATGADRTGALSQKSFGGGLAVTSAWNDNHISEVQGYASWYDLTARNEALESDQVTRQRNSIFDKGVRVHHTYNYSEQLSFDGGYQFNEVSVRNADAVNAPAFSRDSREALVTHAVAVQAGYASADGKTAATGGLRANYFEKYGMATVEPRLTVSHELSGTLTLEAAAEQKSQTTSQIIDRQQDFLGIEKRRWVLANDNDIPVQKSTQASAGLSWSKNGWFASAEVFYKKITGITSDSQGFRNQFEFLDSTGSYTVTGTELLLQKRLGSFYAWASYSYNDNNYRFDGFVPPGFENNFAIAHALSAAIAYDRNSLKLALGAKWRTGAPVTAPTGFNIDPDNAANSSIAYDHPNSTILASNLQVNFSAAKSWQLSNGDVLTASCSVLNVLDRENIIGRHYRINTQTNTVESIDTYGLGLTPNFALKLVF